MIVPDVWAADLIQGEFLIKYLLVGCVLRVYKKWMSCFLLGVKDVHNHTE